MRVYYAVILLVSCSSLQAQPGEDPQRPERPAPSQLFAELEIQPPAGSANLSPEVATLIDQLNDDRFSVREQATAGLNELGINGIDAIAAAAASDSLETSTRAVGIMLQWAQSEDRQLALKSILRMAGLENHPKESRLARKLIENIREYLAAEQIERMGGHVVRNTTAGLFVPREAVNVIIDLNWTGGIEGLQYLREISNAAKVSFHSAPVGEEAVAILLEMPSVRELEFFGTPVSDVALRSLYEGLPNLAKIDVRSGALMGIEGANNAMAAAGGAMVSGVRANSAAQRAGIQPRDIITAVDGKAVTDFEHLTVLIADYQPNQPAKLTLLRQRPGSARQMELEVRFDRWGAKDPKETSLLANPSPEVKRYVRWLPRRRGRDANDGTEQTGPRQTSDFPGGDLDISFDEVEGALPEQAAPSDVTKEE